MTRTLIVHPRFLSGGSEGRALTIVELLQNQHDVTLLTSAPLGINCLNAAYQTAVDPNRIAVEMVPMPGGLRHSMVGDGLRGAFIQRHARQMASRFDICISAYNFMTFGRKAIQFIADFSWDDGYRRLTEPPPPGIRNLFQRDTPARLAYLNFCRLILGNKTEECTGKDAGANCGGDNRARSGPNA